MRRVTFECTASSSTNSILVAGSSGNTIFDTRKCFSLAIGCTAVHLDRSIFFGWIWFMIALHRSPQGAGAGSAARPKTVAK